MLDLSAGFSIGGLIVFIISVTAIGLCLFNRRSKKGSIPTNDLKSSSKEKNNNEKNGSSKRRVSINNSIRLQKFCGPPPVIIVTLAQSEDELAKDSDIEALDCDKTPNGIPIATTEVTISDVEKNHQENIKTSAVNSETQESQ